MDRETAGNVRCGRAFLAAMTFAFSFGFGAGVLSFDATRPPALQDGHADVVPRDPGQTSPGAALAAVEDEPPRPVAIPVAVPHDATPPPRAERRSATPLHDAAAAAGLTSAAAFTQPARSRKGVLTFVPPSAKQVIVQSGDTLMHILTDAGIDRGQAYAAILALEEVYDPRHLRAGQALEITARPAHADEGATRQLVALSLDASFDHEIQITRNDDGAFASSKVERPQQHRLVHRSSAIDDSLYLAAERVAMPQEVTFGLVKLFSWDVDFQRDLHPGNEFEALFEEVSLTDATDQVRGGDILYARLALSGRELEAYRFRGADGAAEYYDRTGRSLRKFLLRTPVDGARISSRFGMRRHPILGYSRMHKGMDFAAPTGTPIYAAGSGRIAAAGRNGGYGNYVKIRHNGEYSTAYAHLSRIANGISRGATVRQGQVIGYVGSTGRSTGPHLHYEILRQDVQINPQSIKQPPQAQLAGADLQRFRQEMARIDRLRARLADSTVVADRTQGTSQPGG